MNEPDELEDIRERKREQLRQRLEGGDSPVTGESGAAEGAESPADPVYVHGAEELNDLVSRHGVVLVDFYADWCGPCKMLEPIVEDLARETEAVVAKVDVDANQTLAGQYGVRGVPTLVLFSGGDPVEQLVGAKDKGTLEALIDRYAA